ncbi:hypothetical protein [Morganella psychrotolerans]|uniref:hypothetical protein n=1 Tax=Morganella psychrotolerans TaxID=368603 RepID=UPI0012E9D9DD|nr:hypothetical protein [Morganella psychrotolerans]
MEHTKRPVFAIHEKTVFYGVWRLQPVSVFMKYDSHNQKPSLTDINTMQFTAAERAEIEVNPIAVTFVVINRITQTVARHRDDGGVFVNSFSFAGR